jgi:hypothetical protein
MQESNGKLGFSDYSKIADGFFVGAGEWIFTSDFTVLKKGISRNLVNISVRKDLTQVF